MPNAKKPDKMKILKGLVNRNKWVSNSSKLLQVLNRKNGHVEQKLATFFNRLYISCSNMRRFPLFSEMAYRLKFPTLLLLLRVFLSSFEKKKRSNLTLLQKFGEIYFTTQHNNSHQA